MKISNALTTIFSLLFISAKAHLDANPSPLQNAVIHTPSNRITAASEFNITFGIKGYSQNVTFVLEPNKDLISKDTHVQYLDTEGKISHSDLITPSMHRIFKGTVWTPSAWEKVGWARILMLRDGVDPLFEGAFTIASEQYQIRSQSTVAEDTGNAKEQVMVYRISKSNLEGRSDDKSSSPQSICRSGEHHSIEPSFALLERQFNQGDLTDTIGSTSGCPNRRRVAYVGIATDCSYTAAFDSTDAVRQNILSVVNTASVVFENSFNISLGLRNLTISDAACPESASDSTPWNVACSTGDLNWRLNRFSSWRGSIDDDDNAYWTLMTECNTGGEVGVSWIGALCNYGSFGYTTSVGANVVARVENAEWQVFAHESAHTFGAVHDCNSNTCAAGYGSTSQCCPLSSSTCDAGGEYIMNPSVAIGMTRFSPCSIGNVCSQLRTGSVNTRCLVDYNDAWNNGTINSPGTCGNGIVEDGEECDCGGDSCEGRDAECCDAATCQWRGECSSGNGGNNRSTGDSLTSWVDRHRSLVIGLCAGVGGALLFLVVACLLYSCRRRRKTV